MGFSPDQFSAIVGFIITILILSYLLGDNPLFRAAVYVFVGVAAGYVAAVAWNQVIRPLLLQPILSGAVFQDAWLLVPILGSILLLAKIWPRSSKFGQFPIAYLVGVGAAVAIGGAVLGTLLPQINATIDGFDVKLAAARGIDSVLMMLTGGSILLGVVGTLAYFHFGARQQADGSTKRNFLVNILAWIGRVYIAITFGVLFAGVYMAALTALIERMDAIRSYILLMVQSF